MALILTRSTPPLVAGTYLRIDGIRFEPVARPRGDGIWSVDPQLPVRFHVYAYRSVASRVAGDAPIAANVHATTLAALAFLETVPGTAHLRLGPALRMREIDSVALWRSLYRQLHLAYPECANDEAQRCPDGPRNAMC